MIEKIQTTRYKISDGRIFETEAFAEIHEFNLQLVKDLRKSIGIENPEAEKYISLYKNNIIDVLENLKINFDGRTIHFKPQSEEIKSDKTSLWNVNIEDIPEEDKKFIESVNEILDNPPESPNPQNVNISNLFVPYGNKQ